MEILDRLEEDLNVAHAGHAIRIRWTRRPFWFHGDATVDTSSLGREVPRDELLKRVYTHCLRHRSRKHP